MGYVFVAKSAKGICRISFPHPTNKDFTEPFLKGAFSGTKDTGDIKIQRDDSFLKPEIEVLQAYFHGKLVSFHGFSLDLDQGTPFQKKVWNKLMEIPYGTCRSYKWVAKEIGQPLASRAVGMANNKNPLPPVIPCHRVIGSHGSLTGYAFGITVKKELLEMESRTVHGHHFSSGRYLQL